MTLLKSMLALFAVATLSWTLQAQSFTFTTLAGPIESPGAIDGTGDAARFAFPSGLAVDSRGNVYVADRQNNAIRKISPSGAVTTLAGYDGSNSFKDGPQNVAGFFWPEGVAVDRAGNVYVADSLNHTIRKITAGVVTTVAGKAQTPGSTDGPANSARFNRPVGVAVDDDGNLYVADQNNRSVRKITSTGIVTTLPGRYVGTNGNAGNPENSTAPAGIAVDQNGNVYVAGGGDCVVRKITPEGFNLTLAGIPGQCGSDDGWGIAARFESPKGIAVDQSGNVWVSDVGGGVRKITANGEVTTAARVNDSWPCTNGLAVDRSGKIYVTDACVHTILTIDASGTVTPLAGRTSRGLLDGPARDALFKDPEGVAVDSAQNVYVADTFSDTVRKITPLGMVTTILKYDGGARSPIGLAIDSSDSLYVSNSADDAIRKITSKGVVTILAGPSGTFAIPGTGATGSHFERGIAADPFGNIYVADTNSHVIRKITASGVVSTFAGLDGNAGSADGAGTNARFFYPAGLAADSSGNVYVADSGNATIRRIRPDGVVSTVAGVAGSYGGADGSASKARFADPKGVAVDGNGNLYVTDVYLQTIRKVTPAGDVTTVAGSEFGAQIDVDETGSRARFFWPQGIAVDRNGNVYVTDNGHAVRIGKPTFTDVSDVASIDVPSGAVNAVRQLDASPKTATSYQWFVIRRPADSVAELSSATIRNPTFAPDVPGLFRFRLIATGGGAMRVSTVDLLSATIPARRQAVRH